MEKTPAELEAEQLALAKAEEADLVNQNGQVKTSAEIAAELQEKYKDLEPADMILKISEDLAKKNEIISHKNRAINALKKPKEDPTPPTPVVSPDDIDAKVKAIVEQQLSSFRDSSTVETRIASLSSDAGEQAKIREAYNTSIVKSGDVEADLKKALAIANFSIIDDYRKTKSEAEVNELMMTRFMGGAPSGGQQDGNPLSDPVKKGAYENMLKAGVSEEAAIKAIKNM